MLDGLFFDRIIYGDKVKYIIEKRNYVILFIIVLLLICIFLYPKRKPFVKSYKSHGTITITIYDKIDYKKIDKKISNLCQNYKKNFKINHEIFDDSYDLDGAYIVKNIIKYFEKENINRYIINENGNISAGKNYNGGKYLVSINKPGSSDILNTLKIDTESMATLNYEGDHDSTIVLHKDNLLAFTLANYLSDKGIEETKKICKKYLCEAYFIKDDKIEMTDGFKKIIK